MKAGKLPENILLRSVIKPVHKTETGNMISSAGVGEDCAVFMSENDTNTVTSINTTVLVNDGMPTVSLLGAINSVAAGGAKPRAALISLVLPVSSNERCLKDIMNELIGAAKMLGVDIAGGHTESSKSVQNPILTITAIGERAKASSIRKARPGDTLLVTKDIGLAGSYIIARNQRQKLLDRYPASFIDEALLTKNHLSVVPEAAVAASSGDIAMHDASHGGIYTAMWEMAEAAGAGLDIELERIPIRQQTVEICDYLDLNPYELLAGGSLLIATKDSQKVIDELGRAGVDAVAVGRFTEGSDRIIRNGEETRFLEPFRGDNVIL